MKFKPLGDRVLVQKQEEEKEKKVGSIYIPDPSHDRTPDIGTIIAVGPGRTESGRRVEMEVKEGDFVLYPKYGVSQTEVRIDGETYLLFREQELLGILQN